MECLRDAIEVDMSWDEDEHTIENIFDVPQYYFPPEDRPSDGQVSSLINSILELSHAFHYEAVFCKSEFTERDQNIKLIEHWKKAHPLFRGNNGTWDIEIYDYEQYWNEEYQCYLSEEVYLAKHIIYSLMNYQMMIIIKQKNHVKRSTKKEIAIAY
jgi:hypothetical protein